MSTKQELYAELGTILKNARLKTGLSQRDVAKEIGYNSPQFISNYERGLCMPPLNKLKLIIDLYAISPKKIVDLIVNHSKLRIYKELNLKYK